MNRSLLLLDAFAAHPGDAVSRALSGVLESAGAGCLPRFAQWLGLPPDAFLVRTYFSCWMRIMFPAGSRTPRSRTP